MLSIQTLIVGSMAANCYIIGDSVSRECVVVDPGDDAEYIAETILKNKYTPTNIIATHGHFDHIMGGFALQRAFKIPFAIHEDDIFLVARMNESARHFLGITAIDPAPEINKTYAEGDTILIGNYSLQVLHTPGHTPGSVSLYDQEGQQLFVGDTIFQNGGVGRTDFSYSSSKMLRMSVDRILALTGGTTLLPGHGQSTIVAAERGIHVH